MLKSNFTFKSTELKKLGKLSFFVIAIILLLLILAAGGYLLYFFCFRTLPPAPPVKNVAPYLRHGDVIMRSGVGLWSELFRKYNLYDKRFSHTGIVIEKAGRFWVLHSEGSDISGRGNVHLDTLEYFVGESSAIGVSRLHTLDGNMLAANALKYTGRQFDWKFDRQESEMIYCTELIDLSLQEMCGGEAGLTVNKDGIIPVDSCLDRRYFTEIPLHK